MILFLSVLEAAALASSCSLDAFSASFAYGNDKIKIPFLSNQIINLICSSALGLSLWAGAAVRRYLPEWLTIAACFVILFIMGVTKLLDSATKSIIRKHNRLNKEALCKEISFSMFNFRFILNLYANPEEADVDESKTISPEEAAALAVSLSLDGIAVGFGAALADINPLAVFFCSLVTNMLAVSLGCRLGNTAARKLPFDMSWLSGSILIVMAFMKLI